MYEVIDFFAHGSNHCPVYIRLKVHPRWRKKPGSSVRRIMKTSGFESLRKKLDEGSIHRAEVVTKILSFFSNLKWSGIKTRQGMDESWSIWVKKYKLMVETLIGTRPAKVASWGRKFDLEVRRLCKEASIARSWFIEAKRAGG